MADNTVLRVRAISERAPGQWLHLAFLADALLGRFAAMAPGVGMVHLTAERMRNWPVPLAPPGEQGEVVQRVRAALDTVLVREDALEAVLSSLKGLDSAVLEKAFQGTLVSRIGG